MSRKGLGRTVGREKNRKGFTLAELLIVVAVIAVLVAIAIPVFSSQLEKARQATDMANARAAYASAMAQWITDPKTETTKYVFNGSAAVIDGPAPAAYGKSSANSSTWDNMPFAISGVPLDNYVTVTIDPDGVPTLQWGTAYGSKWAALSNTTITTVSSGDNWYGMDGQSKINKKTAYESVIATDNAKRREADVDILNSIADYFNKANSQKLHDVLGTQYNSIVNGGGGVLFKYQVDGGDSYSVRLNPDVATASTDYFTALGYSPKVYSSSLGQTDGAFSFSRDHNYVDTYLLTSDEVIGTRSQEHQVRVKVSGSGTRVWITNTDLEVYLEK